MILSAHELCRVITDYWRNRGYDGIRCHVEHLPMSAVAGRWYAFEVVRSNIGPLGYPPKDIFAAYRVEHGA